MSSKRNTLSLGDLVRDLHPGGVQQIATPSYKTDPVAWIRDRRPCIDSKGYGGVIPFEPWPYQKEVMRYFWAGGTYFIKKDRQMGYTTTVLMAVAHKLLYGMEIQNVPFHFHLLADTGEKAQDLLRMVKMALTTADLSDEERAMIRGADPQMNNPVVRFGLHSYVRCHATTGRSVRGYSGNGVLVEEAAFIENLPEVWKSTVAMVSELEEMVVKPSVWVVSSPNGPSYHEELCEHAAQWDATFLPYDFRQVPGRDAAWEERERARLGDEIFEEEHGLRIIGDDEPLFSLEPIRRFAAEVQPLEVTPIPGHRYSKGLDVSGSSGVTVFVATDVTYKPAQPVCVKEIKGSFAEKLKQVADLDAQYPGPLHADGTWDSSFVGSLKDLVLRMIPVRFTGGSQVGSGHDAEEKMRWTYYPRERMSSGTKRALGSGRVVLYEETQPKLWEAVKTARGHAKHETSGKTKRRGRHPDVLDAFMLSLIPLIPKGAGVGGKGNMPRPIKSSPSVAGARGKKW